MAGPTGKSSPRQTILPGRCWPPPPTAAIWPAADSQRRNLHLRRLGQHLGAVNRAMVHLELPGVIGGWHPARCGHKPGPDLYLQRFRCHFHQPFAAGRLSGVRRLAGRQHFGGGGLWRGNLPVHRLGRDLGGDPSPLHLLVCHGRIRQWRRSGSGGSGGAGIYTSTDAGNTWTLTSAVSTNWSAIASSADGSRLVAAVNGGGIYRSTYFGADWSATTAPSNYWSAVYSSPDGCRLAAAANGGGLAAGVRFTFPPILGASWTNASAPRANWSAISAPADGSQWLATVNGGMIYRSTNGGAAWTTNNGLPGLVSITSQTNISGQGWTTIFSTTTNSVLTSPSQYWSAVAASADGSRVVAANNHSIFTAYNSGTRGQDFNVNHSPGSRGGWRALTSQVPGRTSNRLVWRRRAIFRS